MDDELKSLLKQKRQIERRIKELKNVTPSVAGARLHFERYPKWNEWKVIIEEIHITSDAQKNVVIPASQPRNKAIVTAPTKEEALNGLKDMIERLSSLYQKLTSDSDQTE